MIYYNLYNSEAVHRKMEDALDSSDEMVNISDDDDSIDVLLKEALDDLKNADYTSIKLRT